MDTDAASNQDAERPDSPLDEDPPRAVASGYVFYPEWLKTRDWWVNWVLALPFELEDDEGSEPLKQPIAPYRRPIASPVEWNSGLDESEHPRTDHQTVKEWAGHRIGIEYGLPASWRVVSDTVGIGIIIPVNQGTADDARPFTLIDWDDVRDPETGEIHPTAARAIRELDGYVEISQSGKGLHQYVFGEIPGGFKKLIRYIDEEPFVGEDLPHDCPGYEETRSPWSARMSEAVPSLSSPLVPSRLVQHPNGLLYDRICARV